MKKLLRSTFCLSLAAAFVFGAVVTLTPAAQAGATCPSCYIWDGAPGWSQYGNCNDFSDPHCPLLYRLYKNDHTGQMCRGQFAIANI